MNPQFRFVSSREFWAGVGLTLAAILLVGIGVPNLLRSGMPALKARKAVYPAVARFDRLTALSAGYTDTDTSPAASFMSDSDNQRKMIRTSSLDMLVKSPKDEADKIRAIAQQAGGFLVTSDSSGAGDTSSASVTVRVPIGKFEQVHAEVIKLGLKIESEKLEAQDVTKQYVDQEARLRNLRAQETQYLGILKQAKTVKDTVEVSEKLNEVRLQIEQQQAEFEALSKQVETVALTVSLHAEAEAQVFGLHWRPLYQLKVAAREGIDGIGDYAAAMAGFVFYIPAIILWLATILIGAALIWRIMRWAWRLLFASRPKVT